MRACTVAAARSLRGAALDPALNGLELVAVVAAVVVVVGGGGGSCIGSHGRASSACGSGRGTGRCSRDGLSVTVGDHVEGVVGELEEGLFALADFELFGGSHVVVERSNVGNFSVCYDDQSVSQSVCAILFLKMSATGAASRQKLSSTWRTVPETFLRP